MGSFLGGNFPRGNFPDAVIYEKNSAFKNFPCDRNISFIKRQLNILQDRLITSTEASKQKYYCRMTIN